MIRPLEYRPSLPFRHAELQSYPRHAIEGIFFVEYPGEENTEFEPSDVLKKTKGKIQSFLSRWGGLDDETLLHALREGNGQDRYTAIFALGYGGQGNVTDTLAPYLESPDLLVRCAVAFILCIKRDERAYDVLKEYLLTDFRFDTSPEGMRLNAEAREWYWRYREVIALNLSAWGPSSFNEVLRQALHQTWREEKKHFPCVTEFQFHDNLCYALGQRGIFGALAGLDFSPYRMRLAMLHMVLGYIQVRERVENWSREYKWYGPFQYQLTQALRRFFALTEEECQDIFRFSSQDSKRRMFWQTFNEGHASYENEARVERYPEPGVFPYEGGDDDQEGVFVEIIEDTIVFQSEQETFTVHFDAARNVEVVGEYRQMTRKPNGAYEFLLNDGTVLIAEPGGYSQVPTSGTSFGNIENNPVSREFLYCTDGTKVTLIRHFDDDKNTYVPEDFVQKQVSEDGTISYLLRDNTRFIQYHNGTFHIVRPTGTIYYSDYEGRRMIKHPDFIDNDGTQVYVAFNAEFRLFAPTTYKRVIKHMNGYITFELASGTKIVEHPDGTRIIERANGIHEIGKRRPIKNILDK